MLGELFNWFYELISSLLNYGDYFEDIIFTIGGDPNNYQMYPTMHVSMAEWLSLTMALIAFVIILVLCCFFIYRLIRLVARLFSGGVL